MKESHLRDVVERTRQTVSSTTHPCAQKQKKKHSHTAEVIHAYMYNYREKQTRKKKRRGGQTRRRE